MQSHFVDERVNQTQGNHSTDVAGSIEQMPVNDLRYRGLGKRTLDFILSECDETSNGWHNLMPMMKAFLATLFTESSLQEKQGHEINKNDG